MRFASRLAIFFATAGGIGLALARNIDLQLTLESAFDVESDIDKAYCEVLLSKVVPGPGPAGPLPRSRYLGPIPNRERRLLPESRRNESKIYTSHTVKGDDDEAEWNDMIVLRNVPDDAKVTLRLWNRNSIRLNDWLGDAIVDLRTSGVAANVGREVELEEEINVDGLFGDDHEGDMKVRIKNLGGSSDASVGTFRDGPIKWRRYHSKFIELVTAGLGAMVSGKKGYYIYSIDLHRMNEAFQGVRVKAVKTMPITIEANKPVTGTILTQEVRAHHGFANGENPGNAGEVNDARGFFDVFDWGRGPEGTGKRFTYIARDGFLRFTETGSSKRQDFASKHFMLADGNQDVFVAGEMFVIPADRVPKSVAGDIVFGGALRRHNGPHLTNPPEDGKPVPEGTKLPLLVIDNASGTFAPPKSLLSNLIELLQYNFQGLDVLPVAFDDPRMAELKVAGRIVN